MKRKLNKFFNFGTCKKLPCEQITPDERNKACNKCL